MPLRIGNAIDLHCHFGLDTVGGSLESGDPFGAIPGAVAAQEAKENGFAALVLKSHGFASPGVANNVQESVPDLQVFGGICTDHPTGGLNTWAVEAALAMGAKIVWLPTVHSAGEFGHLSEMDEFHQSFGPIPVVGDDGRPLRAVYEIFDLVKQTDTVLATGHISSADHYTILKELARSGKLLVTHACESRTAKGGFTAQECKELADLGATIELTALACCDLFGQKATSPTEVMQIIQTVGAERCTLSTDYGWSGPPIPRAATGFLEFLECLWHEGVPEADLIMMASTTPARLLDISLT